MNTTETMIATLVPRWPNAGDGPGDAVLSLHFAPRVQTDGAATLADCPWLSSWPDLALTVGVQVQGSPDPVTATVVSAAAPAERAAAWAALLPPNTPVSPFPAPDTGRPAALRAARTFSSPATFALAQHTYASALLGSQPVSIVDAGPPPISVPLPAWLQNLPPRPPILSGAIKGIDPGFGHHVIDLHERLAYLHDFPFLLRQLGLVLDLRITPAADWSADERVTARAVLTATHPKLGPATLRTVTPWTTLPLRPAATDGYLPAGTFALVPLDTVHAAAALTATAIGPLPALHATGLSIVDAGSGGQPTRHLTLADRVDHQLLLEQQLATADTPDAVLEPADTTLGVVADIADLTEHPVPKWTSLCGREGTVVAANQRTTFAVPPGDEGFISDAASTRPGEALRLLDVYTRWQGWSAVAARPVSPLGPPARAGATPAGPTATFTPPPGSLPRLRYGHSYAARLRTMNIAGNTPPGPLSGAPTDPDGVACEAVTYLRTEPVGAPVIVLGSEPGLGESLLQPVVYSQGVMGRGEPSETRRWILPPRTSLDVIERHGLLDSPAAAPDSTKAQALAARADADLTLTTPALGSAKATLARAQLHTASPGVPYLPDPLAVGVTFALRLDPDTPGSIHPVMRASATFTTVGIGADPGAWPAAWAPVALTIRGVDGHSAPTLTVDADSGVLVELPQGHRARLALAVTPDATALDAHHALPRWVQDAVPTATLPSGLTDEAYLAEWSSVAQTGGLQQVTPCVELDLLHAVCQPVFAPTMAGLPEIDQPTAGITQPGVTVTVQADPLTSDKVDVYAQWSVDSDLDPDANPDRDVTPPIRVHVGTVSVPLAVGAPSTVTVSGLLPFHDTLARHVRFDAVATTRFRENFVEAHTIPIGALDVPASLTPPLTPPPQLTVTGPSVSVLRLSTAAPTPPRIHSVVPTLAWTDPVTGPGTVSRSRSGNTVRIWLERPFQTSGYGQQLAVVLSPGTPVSALSVGPASPVPSIWGADPMSGKATDPPQTMAAVLGPATAYVPAVLPDMQNAPPDLAAAVVDVEYDPELNRWFCDLALPGLAGAFMPLVNLLLCAYQPNSVPPSLGVAGTDIETSPDIRFSSGISTGWFTLVSDCTVTLTMSVDTSYEKGNTHVTNPSGPWTALDMTVAGPRGNFDWAFTSGDVSVPLAFIATITNPPKGGGDDQNPPGSVPKPGSGPGPKPFTTYKLEWSTDVPAGDRFTAQLIPSADLTVTVTARGFSNTGALLFQSDLTAVGVPNTPPALE